MRLGLIVNPIAGVGGPAGLKGSDGPLAALALSAGASDLAAARGRQALEALSGAQDIVVVTSARAMGEAVARVAKLPTEVVHAADAPTGPEDTIAAARAIVGSGVDLLVFVGGDGTARDLVDAGLGSTPMLGVPAGVKMLSAVFATSPRTAGALLLDWSRRGVPPATPADVLDRTADGGIALFGTVAVPRATGVQRAKAGGDGAPGATIAAAARGLARELAAAPLAIIGPGATTMLVKQALAGEGTLLGVDAYAAGVPVALDASARALVSLAERHTPRIVLGVIGRQGILLGRGNAPIGPALLRLAGRRALDVIADADKLVTLADAALLLDTGDPALDTMLAGHLPVRTGARTRMMMRIEPA